MELRVCLVFFSFFPFDNVKCALQIINKRTNIYISGIVDETVQCVDENYYVGNQCFALHSCCFNVFLCHSATQRETIGWIEHCTRFMCIFLCMCEFMFAHLFRFEWSLHAGCPCAYCVKIQWSRFSCIYRSTHVSYKYKKNTSQSMVNVSLLSHSRCRNFKILITRLTGLGSFLDDRREKKNQL